MSYASTELNVHVTGRRVVSTILDGILIGIIYGILSAIFHTGKSNASAVDMASFGNGATWLSAVVTFVYFWLMEGLRGQTIGKMITGIKVIDEQTGGVPGLGKSAIRTVLRIIDGLLGFLVGFVIVLNSSRRRRLGDIAAGTLVVRA